MPEKVLKNIFFLALLRIFLDILRYSREAEPELALSLSCLDETIHSFIHSLNRYFWVHTMCQALGWVMGTLQWKEGKRQKLWSHVSVTTFEKEIEKSSYLTTKIHSFAGDIHTLLKISHIFYFDQIGLYLHKTNRDFFFFFFLWQHLQHLEVPRLGVESELPPPAYTTATATPDPSDLHHSLWQHWILIPPSEAMDQTCILMDTMSGY